MNALRKVGSLGVAMIIAVGSIVLGAAPASAASGYTHYENVGNPGWCLDGNGTQAYLHRCGSGDVDYQLWFYTRGEIDLQLIHNASGTCLRARGPSRFADLGTCTGPESHWDARGRNGWVMLWNRAYGQCLVPVDTHKPGREAYPVGLVRCDPEDPNVPNLFAWRYFN